MANSPRSPLYRRGHLSHIKLCTEYEINFMPEKGFYGLIEPFLSFFCFLNFVLQTPFLVKK